MKSLEKWASLRRREFDAQDRNCHVPVPKRNRVINRIKPYFLQQTTGPQALLREKGTTRLNSRIEDALNWTVAPCR
ncbi:MAG: hypothetical protein DME91_00905 [Verrucomicrobia bacterium]|nr:MAG: hypothetical protein DME91_00905 [Verrucomicrobiota bacterium]